MGTSVPIFLLKRYVYLLEENIYILFKYERYEKHILVRHESCEKTYS